MPVLSDLEPREVFAWFERLCAIPHSSHHAKSDQRLSGRVRPRTRSCLPAGRCQQCRHPQGSLRRIRKRAGRHAAGPYRHGLRKGRGLRQDMETEGLDLFVDGDGIAVAMALRRPGRRRYPPRSAGVRLHGGRGGRHDRRPRARRERPEGKSTSSTSTRRRKGSSRSAALAPAARSARCPSRACPLMEKRSASRSAVLSAGTPARRSTRAAPTPTFCSARAR